MKLKEKESKPLNSEVPLSASEMGVDGSKWAHEFVRLHGGDEGLMLSWFCNAIMAGYDEARRSYEQSEPETWKELREHLDPAYCHSADADVFEAAWPEIERRVGRMIKNYVDAEIEGVLDSDLVTRKQLADAIKSERERLMLALRDVNRPYSFTDEWALRLAAKLEGES